MAKFNRGNTMAARKGKLATRIAKIVGDFSKARGIQPQFVGAIRA